MNMITTLSRFIIDHPKEFDQHHIAGIFRRGVLQSVGFNRKKSHPFQKKYGRNEYSIYLHAEVNAIYNYIRRFGLDDLDKCILVSIKVKNNIIMPAKPCIGCARCIKQFNLKGVIYADS